MQKKINTLNIYFLLLFATVVSCSTDQKTIDLSTVNEEGKFLVYRRQSHIGEENYTLKSTSSGLVLNSLQGENERGKITGVEANLKLDGDFKPTSYRNIRIANGDTTNKLQFQVGDGEIMVKELFFDEVNHDIPNEDYFPIHSHTPAAVEMMLYHYYFEKGIKGPLKTYPRGEINITHRAVDVVNIDGKEIPLDRYTVSGINWGDRTIWLDESKHLIAVVKANTQIREMIREGYESALPVFVKGNVDEQMRQLDEYTAKHKGNQEKVKALVGVDIVDGIHNTTQKDMTVIIDGRTISKIGKRTEVSVPSVAHVFHLKGKTIMPGLWDMHVHANQVQWAPACLAGGITTMRCNGNEVDLGVAFKNAIQKGALGPDLLLSGMTDGKGKKGNGAIRARTPEEAYEVVQMYHSKGYDQIKCYQYLEPEVLKVLCDEAHKLGWTAAGHTSTPVGNTRKSIELGMDLFSHRTQFLSVLFPDKHISELGRYFLYKYDITDEIVEDATNFLLEHGTIFDPTVALDVYKKLPHGTPLESIDPDVARLPYELWEEKRFLAGVSPELSEYAQKDLDKGLELLTHFLRAGVQIVAGPDNVMPGFGLYTEVETYCNRGGMTPLEALQTATIIPARVMGIEDKTGSIEVGKEADISILTANPLDDITNIRKCVGALTNGDYYESNPLWIEAGFEPKNYN